MKYQKIIPATKPNIVHIPDQNTDTANTKGSIKKKEGETENRNALPMLCRITYQHHG